MAPSYVSVDINHRNYGPSSIGTLSAEMPASASSNTMTFCQVPITLNSRDSKTNRIHRLETVQYASTSTAAHVIT